LIKALYPHDWFNGVYLWLWRTDTGAGGRTNDDYTPQNKPAAEVMKRLFKTDDAVSSYSLTIDNNQPRLGVGGEIINSHDGTIRFLEGKWWLHVASYGADACKDPPLQGCQRVPGKVPCGFQGDHNVSIYTSTNLSSGYWSYVGDAIRCEEVPGCKILYRPHLVFNPNAKKYTLFYNYVRKVITYWTSHATMLSRGTSVKTRKGTTPV